MKPYSIDLRERVVGAIEKGDSSFRKVAQRFGVSKNCVERWGIQKRTQGNVNPRKQVIAGLSLGYEAWPSPLASASAEAESLAFCGCALAWALA